MNYYIATDKFGNYDLAHYGVKGMKWGVVNKDLTSIDGIANRVKSVSPAGSGRSGSSSRSSSGSSKDIWAAGRTGAQLVREPVKTSASKLNQQVAHEPVKTSAPKLNQQVVQKVVEASSETPKDEDEIKIAEANVNYQSALMNMQLLARISLSNGISPAANPEYLVARRKAIEAKYELDKLTLAKQEKVAINPPTMVEQKRADDSNAKKQLAEDKAKTKS